MDIKYNNVNTGLAYQNIKCKCANMAAGVLRLKEQLPNVWKKLKCKILTEIFE